MNLQDPTFSLAVNVMNHKQGRDCKNLLCMRLANQDKPVLRSFMHIPCRGYWCSLPKSV